MIKETVSREISKKSFPERPPRKLFPERPLKKLFLLTLFN